MAHNAGNFVVANILPRAIAARPGAYPINHVEAAQLEQILRDDAKDYFYSATISTANALLSITNGHFSWATVELYYSDFYLLRGMLATIGICVFYEGSKPRLLSATPSAAIQNVSGKRAATTHGAVLETAKRHLQHVAALSQDISGENPLDWVRARREFANYGQSKFSEPLVPQHILMCYQNGVRKSLNVYLTDRTLLYPFDPDHAMVAYNLLLWQHLRDELRRFNKFDFSDDDFAYLRSLFFDDAGALSGLTSLLQP